MYITAMARILRIRPAMSEKRQFVRHPSSIPVEVHLLAGTHKRVCVNDISLGGLAFPFHWPIAEGVRIEVRVPRLADSLALTGRVARCERRGREWLIGVSFEDREEVFRMRMVQQICHVEDYRARVMEDEGRDISSDEAAQEWIARHASHFPRCGL